MDDTGSLRDVLMLFTEHVVDVMHELATADPDDVDADELVASVEPMMKAARRAADELARRTDDEDVAWWASWIVDRLDHHVDRIASTKGEVRTWYVLDDLGDVVDALDVLWDAAGEGGR